MIHFIIIVLGSNETGLISKVPNTVENENLTVLPGQ